MTVQVFEGSGICPECRGLGVRFNSTLRTKLCSCPASLTVIIAKCEPLKKKVGCPACSGTGHVPVEDPASIDFPDGWMDCETCEGTGKVR